MFIGEKEGVIACSHHPQPLLLELGFPSDLQFTLDKRATEELAEHRASQECVWRVNSRAVTAGVNEHCLFHSL